MPSLITDYCKGLNFKSGIQFKVLGGVKLIQSSTPPSSFLE